MNTPDVASEWETLNEILAGKSIARFGDGECRLMEGGGCVSQIADPDLRAELRSIIRNKDSHCLVGIPTFDPKGPKFGNWKKYIARFEKFTRTGKQYHSAFVSRPDSAPWINTAEYFDAVESLWRDQVVVLVHCGERSLNPEIMSSAKRLISVTCPRRDAYSQIWQLRNAVTTLVATEKADRVILCAGATATCLAYRLSALGIHAIDLGHIGSFWRRYATPEAPQP